MKKKSIYYFNEISNFGDAINPILIKKLFNFDPVFETKKRADFIAIGSILSHFLPKKNIHKRFFYKKFLYKKLHVWGSGFIENENDAKKRRGNLTEKFIRHLEIHALRGKLSLSRMEKILGKKLDVPLGDPGLLFSYLLDKKPNKKYKLGIIPHHDDIGNPIFDKIHDSIPNSKIIDILGEPLETLNEIASCECVISTAMHGLIAADSLGIPNKWCEVSDKVIGNGYKFRDYYSVFDIKNPTPLDLTANTFEEKDIQKIHDEYAISQDRVKEIQKNLLEAFPSNVLK